MGSKPKYQESAGEEEHGGGGEGRLDIEGGPEEADEKAGEEVANGVDSCEGTESHAVLFFGDNFGGEGVFEWLFGADVKTSQGKNQGEQPEGMRSSTKENRCNSGKGVA